MYLGIIHFLKNCVYEYIKTRYVVPVEYCY